METRNGRAGNKKAMEAILADYKFMVGKADSKKKAAKKAAKMKRLPKRCRKVHCESSDKCEFVAAKSKKEENDQNDPGSGKRKQKKAKGRRQRKKNQLMPEVED